MNNMKKPKIRFKGFTDDWEQRKLGDIVEFLDTLRKPLTENTRTKGPYPYYGASGVVDHVADYLFNEELILLSEDGANITDRNYPVCFLASGKYWVNNHAHVLRAKPKMDNNFICMSLERKDYSNYNTGMAMPKLNQDTCRRIPVDCPSYEEQKKIGDYFRSLDNLITLHQRKYEKLQIIKKSMLENCFPKNGEKVPKIRFSGFTGDWEQRKLGEMGQTYTGLSGKAKDDFGHGQARFVTYMNVFSNPISNPEMTEPIEIDPKQNEVEVGDVFFTTSSETPEEVGMSSILLEKRGKTYLNSFCFGFRPSEKIDSYYLAYMLRSESTRAKIIMLAQGISRYNISKNKVMEIAVSLPSLDEQKMIGQYFSQLDNLITLHHRKLNRTQICINRSFLYGSF